MTALRRHREDVLTANREQQKVAGGSQAGRGEVAGPHGRKAMSEAAGRYRRARAANLRHVVGWPDRAAILPRLYKSNECAT